MTLCEDQPRGLRARQPALSVILDVEELIPGRDTSWRSARQDGRALNKPADFERFRDDWQRSRPSEPVGEAKFFEGGCGHMGDGKVRMELKGKEARTV